MKGCFPTTILQETDVENAPAEKQPERRKQRQAARQKTQYGAKRINGFGMCKTFRFAGVRRVA